MWLLLFVGWQAMAPPPPPPIPQSLMVMPPQANLSLQWVQTGPDLDTTQRYTYRVYVEDPNAPLTAVGERSKTGTILSNIGCDGPLGTPPYPVTFHCRVSPLPPLVKKPGLYRVTLTVAHSSDSKESLPSASAPYHVLYPAPQPPYGVVMK